MSIYHPPVVQAILWPEFVTEFGVALQDVEWCANLGFTSSVAASLLGSVWHSHTRECPDTASFLDVPAKVQGQPVSAVERVHLVGKFELPHAHRILTGLLGWLDIQPGSANPKMMCEVFSPSWVDFLQDG